MYNKSHHIYLTFYILYKIFNCIYDIKEILSSSREKVYKKNAPLDHLPRIKLGKQFCRDI